MFGKVLRFALIAHFVKKIAKYRTKLDMGRSKTLEKSDVIFGWPQSSKSMSKNSKHLKEILRRMHYADAALKQPRSLYQVYIFPCEPRTCYKKISKMC